MLSRNLYLLGFMGAGKSHIGRQLASIWQVEFVDLDDAIVKKAGKSIPAIFKEDGEAHFRVLEQACLKETYDAQPKIVALGGGTPCFFDNMDWIKAHGYSVFLDMPIELLVERLSRETAGRPLLHNKTAAELQQFIEEQLNSRRSFYEQSNLIVQTPDAIIEKLTQIMKQKTLLLLHGALGSAEQLSPLKDALAEHFDVHTLNFTGHGGKAWGEQDFSMDLFAKDVLHYLEANHLEQVDILGYSMGGYVALNLAKNNPNRVHRIFTIATKFAWSPESSAKEVKMLNPTAIETKVPAFARALEERHAPQDWKVHLEKTATMMLNLGNGDALGENDFSAIQHEVLVTVGTKDRMVSQEESAQVATWLGNARFEALEGVPHPIEKIDANVLTQRAVDYFLD